MKRWLFYILIISSILASCQQEPKIEELTHTIHQLNYSMEKAYNDGDMKRVAAFYDDDGFLLGPNRYKKQGREAIDKYWIKFENPVRWKLEVIEVAKEMETIRQSTYWQKMKNKPPAWAGFNIPLDKKDDLLFQLGHSKLEYEREDATHVTSDVDFIIVWRRNDEGHYRIFIDTYVKND